MTVVDIQPPLRRKQTTALPPLRDGDRMRREEFHRRYEAMGEGTRAELIEGVVYLWSTPDMPSPVSQDRHGTPHAHLNGWMFYYVARTPGLILAGDSTVLLSGDDEPQPDAVLGIPDAVGGQTRRVRRGRKRYFAGAPELVAEVSASTAAIDLGPKLRAYERHGVREYLAWRTEAGVIDWFARRDGRFEPIAPDPADGLLKSAAFPGLWLDPAALLAERAADLLAAVDRGCATPEHAAFAARVSAPPV